MAPQRLNGNMVQQFRQQLLDWFRESRRNLPWRRTKDPYRIWVSEIMLQQTRVAAVMEPYQRFLERFPSLLSLALAEEDEVLALWSGLGYYRRARMLHKAAQFVAREHAASLPRTAQELRSLPGIGEYTSAAIASIAFGEPVAAVDGNVERVILRLFGLMRTHASVGSTVRAEIRHMAGRLLDPARPGDFNQAMMELGATICLPRNPLCSVCPVRDQCRTKGIHPVMPRKQMQSSEVDFALVERWDDRLRHQVLLEQRPAEKTVMTGMWELPQLDEIAEHEGVEVRLRVRYAIMQTNYYVRVLPVDADRVPPREAERRWVTADEAWQLPLTGLALKILRRTGFLQTPIPTPGVVPLELEP